MERKTPVFLIVFFLMIVSAGAQDTTVIQVTFRLIAESLPGDSAAYITGGIEQLGQWNPGKVKMEYSGSHTWYKKVVLSAPTAVEYKYTLGSWEREGAGADGLPLPNFSKTILRDTLMADTVHAWTNGAQRLTPQHQVTGVLQFHRAMQGKGLADRDVAVWLPHNYVANSNTRYPVIYMQDGQNLFDPATSSFGTEWRLDETCDSLINNHAIPPVIVVGIYNTPDRSAEYAPGEKGNAYMQFVVNTLKPYIDSAYRTMRDEEHTIVGGSSSGGLISFMLAWQYPQVFSKAICMSPALKISDLDYVKVVQASAKKKNLFLYMDVGGAGLETQLAPGIKEMITALKTKGYREGKDFVLITDPEAKHFEAAWAKRFPKALLLCFKKK